MRRIATLAVLSIALAGCASKSATHFAAKDVAKVHIDLKTCHSIPNRPDLECKCRVVLATVDAKDVSK